jgi:hydroxymethylglutaryl-CoA synthase
VAGPAGGSGIVGYGAYVPYHRMERRIIADALGAPAGPGQRAVASFDEDTTSMGVEAGRAALHAAPDGWVPDLLLFATTAPAYLDKTNATAIQAALRLPPSTVAVDLVGGARNGVTALGLAAERAGRSLVVSSDLRVGRPASLDEREGGDAAVAIAFGPVEGSDVLARLVGRGTAGGSSTNGLACRGRTPRACGRSVSVSTPTRPW